MKLKTVTQYRTKNWSRKATSSKRKGIREVDVGCPKFVRVENFHEMLHENHIESFGKSSEVSRASIPPLNPRTVRRWVQILGLITKNAELTTVARFNACSAQLNTILFAVGAFMMVALVHYALIINQDAIQFMVGHVAMLIKIVVTKASS